MNKKYGIALCIVVVAMAAVIWYGITKRQQQTMTNDIASKVIRLHVVANSDTDIDQNLKLKVKDKIVVSLQEKLKGVTTREKAKEIIEKNLSEIAKTAQTTMEQKGFNYGVKAKMVRMEFPVKQYGDLTFPAGTYEALRVELGAASGKNWWCVMYPSLCLIDSTYQVVPQKSKEKLKNTLTPEEYQEIVSGKEDVDFGFKLLDWVDNLFN